MRRFDYELDTLLDYSKSAENHTVRYINKGTYSNVPCPFVYFYPFLSILLSLAVH